MGIIVFILVLIVLIVVHELGHFFVAKWFSMRVDEFGLGYPPKAMTLAKRGGTEYTLNWLPFGGFVKIYGEDGDADAPGSFTSKPRYMQALVLVAGILMNLVFAFVLISLTLAIGMPRALSDEEVRSAPDAVLAISRVVEGSPAARAGLLPGDRILEAVGETKFSEVSAEAFTAFVADEGASPITFSLLRAGEPLSLSATPEKGAIPEDKEKVGLGVGVAAVGTVPLAWWQAPYEGALITIEATKQIGLGLLAFFASVFTFSADLAAVSGPVGIAGAVGDASESGLAALLTLTAIISINLALINLLPIPALDGGRLLFVLIEALIRRPIPAAVAGAINAAGFAFLILLMLAVTASDVWKLVT
ncbi:MAG: site-2 protease family protein [Minisyncoccia bacterium]